MAQADKKKIMVALSGGVDSSVTALLLKKEGIDCMGGCMRLHSAERGDVCSSDADIADAEAVAKKLGMTFFVFDFSSDFEKTVINRFVSAYENGRTPNPCIDCNRYLKFEKLFESARELGCDAIATGHYARIEQDPSTGRYLLKKAADHAKDQSYVLWSLSQDQLARTLFPLGGMTKERIREIAHENGLINAAKRDSQDICFVPDGKYVAFLEEYTKKSYPEGDFLLADGTKIGRHRGIVRYTVGQKKGLGLVLPEPLYVRAVDPIQNTVTLCKNEELFSRELTATGINLIACERIDAPIRLKARIRYRHVEQWATVWQSGKDRIHVLFDEPQRAITKGQSVVLYDGDTVFGGGIIE